ncbi:hypothetical protein QW060_26615 [Myroides ceti]|uniref:Uncharacterized protein n=1 Tax=Paenimyroides ceti TaxID=395087 RepID=A0ABT8D1Y4_9FLAO|nr:hypothetical protein [Paenimyroides ceti]MDN3710396.1 hypothetical protein [Paenimyroides ceti]
MKHHISTCKDLTFGFNSDYSSCYIMMCIVFVNLSFRLLNLIYRMIIIRNVTGSKKKMLTLKSIIKSVCVFHYFKLYKSDRK